MLCWPLVYYYANKNPLKCLESAWEGTGTILLQWWSVYKLQLTLGPDINNFGGLESWIKLYNNLLFIPTLILCMANMLMTANKDTISMQICKNRSAKNY